MISIFKLFRRTVSAYLIGLLFLLAFLGAPKASALSPSKCNERTLRALGVLVVNCSGETTCPTTPGVTFGASNGQENLFVMGDSITVGMVNWGGLMTMLGPAPAGVGLVKDSNYIVVPNSSPDTYRGPSVEATGGWDIQQMQRTLELHSGDLTAATTIVIALGTNADPAQLDTYGGRLDTFISEVHAKNPNAKILWLNTYFNNETEPRHNDINPIINDSIEKAVTDGVAISLIDVQSAIELGTLLAPDSDSVHYTGRGYIDRAEWLTTEIQRQLSGQQTTSTGSGLNPGCSCPVNTPAVSLTLSEDERFRTTWSFLTSEKKLSEEAAAGFMGNLAAESGIDPHNMQDSAPLPDSPTMPVRVGANEMVFPDIQIEGKYGYGIAQWTSANRQKNLIDFATAQQRSTGDLTLQLEFLWKELTENYTSVLSVLQTPGVTIQQASDEVVLRFETPKSVLPPPDGSAESKANELVARNAKGEAVFAKFSGTGGGYSATASCSSAGVGQFTAVNMDSDDQSEAECAEGTEEKGIVGTYNQGKPVQIKVCNVNGQVDVNAQISGQVKALLEASNTAGVGIVPGQGFRDLDGQIEIYRGWCATDGIEPSPGPFPYPNRTDAKKCPGAASPGYSNHGMGFAIDFTCNGEIIPKKYIDAQFNLCFQWLISNASKYGLMEYGNGQKRDEDGYEGWHWSVNGG